MKRLFILEEITAGYRKMTTAGKNLVCENVILVTHSMGGLVARLAAKIDQEGRQRILGVAHGVMPATGAATAYKRTRSGFEGASAVILGWDGADMMATMAYAAGPLELMPFPNYNANFDPYQTPEATPRKHWLRACHQDGRNNEISYDLGTKDFMGSIYLSDEENVWWRLMKEELINPAGKEERAKKIKEARKNGKVIAAENDQTTDFDKFALLMTKTVQKTQSELSSGEVDYYHPVTYAHYAADREQKSFNEVCWRNTEGFYRLSKNDMPLDAMRRITPGSVPLPHKDETPDYLLGKEISDDLLGKVTLQLEDKNDAAYHYYSATFKIDKPREPGDGTVPACSGAAPTKYCRQIFRHEGTAKGQPSYAHVPSYNSPIAQDVTVYSVIRIVMETHPAFSAKGQPEEMTTEEEP
ncbi:MAG: alpha/beta hydrolase [Zoogloeaceae bacterium]|jgi:hypothetical protein|nr:alpha/beta hydrolase [Zoogloeaceae bacterium]